jgi:hypothetical protein
VLVKDGSTRTFWYLETASCDARMPIGNRESHHKKLSLKNKDRFATFYSFFSTPIPVGNFNNKRNQKWDGFIQQALAEKN